MEKASIVLLIALVFFQTLAAREASGNDPVNGGGILYTEPVKAVLFTHRSHGEKQGLTCDRCHSGLFEMEALKVQEKKDFNMESLYRGKYCGACHNGKQAFASDTQCARCHIRIRGTGPQGDMPVYKASESFGQAEREVRFNHEIHTQLTKCSNCHPRPFKVRKGANKITQADHGQQKFCFVCHDGKKSFSWNNCSRCHVKTPAPQQVVSFGHGEKAILFRHQTHTGKLQCGSCHPKLFPFAKGVTKITFARHAEEKACFVCHKEKNGTSFYSDCGRCHRDRKAEAKPQRPGPLNYTMEGAAPVRFLHDGHESYSCATCHPELFAMKKGGTKMTMMDMYQGKSCGACHDGKKAFSSMECARCHKNH
jgi:c(7)-type cytochrome triheme protein